MTWFAHRLGMMRDVLEEQLSRRELRREKTAEKIILRVTLRLAGDVDGHGRQKGTGVPAMPC
ncbi:MAG: hypothetical protein QG671_2203 [Actinomycetota bacterium]|nr:hypothetical protein [Actinomycetota bacterium]